MKTWRKKIKNFEEKMNLQENNGQFFSIFDGEMRVVLIK